MRHAYELPAGRPYDDILASKRKTFSSEGFAFSTDNDALFPFQRDIVRWACAKGRCAIFADTGLGKTLMQLVWAANVPGRVLILAPLAVAQQTEQEAERFGIQGVKYLRKPDAETRITVTNYDRMDAFDLADYTGVVLDESSILKNLTGKTRTALIRAFSGTPYRLACTATPSPNDYNELLNHSEFLGAMGTQIALATWFINDSSDTGTWRLKGHAEDDFWRWVSSWAVSVASPADLGYDPDGFRLPAYSETVHVVDSNLHENTGGLLFRSPEMSATGYHKEKRLSTEKRAERCADLIRERRANGPVLVWCEANYEADALAAQIPDAVEVRGNDRPEDKERAALDFAAGKIPVLISKPSIFGFGMNFQACANAVFCGVSFSFESYYQAVRRIWRFGQQRHVQIDVVVGEGEKHILDVLGEKQRKHSDLKAHMNTYIMKDHPLAGGRGLMDTYETGGRGGTAWKMLLGDSVELIRGLASDIVGLSVFSPPFSDLFVYSNSIHDMGNVTSAAEFFESYSHLAAELLRVTKPGRCCAIHCKPIPTFKWKTGTTGLYDFRGDIIRCMVAAGWTWHSEVCIWKSPVTEMQRTKAHGLLYKQLRKDSSQSRQGIPDYLVVFRKWAEGDPDPVTHTPDEFPLDQWQEWASPVWMTVDQSNTLNVRQAKSDKDEKHICPLQLDVIERAIVLWSNPGDLVFSPFAGIGSEGVMAVRLGRMFQGIELKPEYFDVACRNLTDEERRDGFLFAGAEP